MQHKKYNCIFQSRQLDLFQISWIHLHGIKTKMLAVGVLKKSIMDTMTWQ